MSTAVATKYTANNRTSRGDFRGTLSCYSRFVFLSCVRYLHYVKFRYKLFGQKRKDHGSYGIPSKYVTILCIR